MYKLLVILFTIKLHAQKDIFKYINGKYGRQIIKVARSLESLRTKISKVKCDIRFIEICKRNKLTPTFAKPKLSIKADNRTKRKVTNTILEAELRE